MPAKLTKPQRAVMVWMSKGWKAYVSGGNTRVEINGRRVCTTDTMDALERAGLVTKLGVQAWEVTDLGANRRVVAQRSPAKLRTAAVELDRRVPTRCSEN